MKHDLLVKVGLIGLVLALFGHLVGGILNAEAIRSTKVEYKVVKVQRALDPEALQTFLNSHAKEGWRLVPEMLATEHIAIFER